VSDAARVGSFRHKPTKGYIAATVIRLSYWEPPGFDGVAGRAASRGLRREEREGARVSWLNVLVTLGVALIGAGAVATGAWLNQRGAEAIARHTLEGQRVLARDAALREWRRQKIAPYIEAANTRMRLWLELRDAIAGADETRRQELMEQVLEVHFNILLVTLVFANSTCGGSGSIGWGSGPRAALPPEAGR
jgi:hypothetical protein